MPRTSRGKPATMGYAKNSLKSMSYVVAEEPVWSYPVSAKFPANRENNRVFPMFLPI